MNYDLALPKEAKQVGREDADEPAPLHGAEPATRDPASNRSLVGLPHPRHVVDGEQGRERLTPPHQQNVADLSHPSIRAAAAMTDTHLPSRKEETATATP